METFVAIFLFFLGTIVGSFINVVTLRLGSGTGFGGRSHCFSCGSQLMWHDLVPLASFIILAGKCRYCAGKISWQYPFVEMATGLSFSAFPLAIPLAAPFAPVLYGYGIIAVSLSMAIVVYDIRHKIIPNEFVYPLIGIAALMPLALWLVGGTATHALAHTAAGATGFLFFAVLWFFSGGRWMGFGDAKLSLALGFLLGFSLGAAAFLIAFWAGAIFGIALLILPHTTRLFKSTRRFTIKSIALKSEIPFAPFLVFGALIAFAFDVSFLDIQNLLTFWLV